MVDVVASACLSSSKVAICLRNKEERRTSEAKVMIIVSLIIEVKG